MTVKYAEENRIYSINCTEAVWSTDQIHAYYQDAEHVKAIIQLNQIENPDYIYPGMVLKLP